MSETNAQEPTMEEILASIRRIISEDDAPSPAQPEAVAEPAPSLVSPPSPMTPPSAPSPVPMAAKPPPPVEEDVLELTEPLDTTPESPSAPHKETLGDTEAVSSSPTLPPPTPRAAPAAPPVFKEEPLLGSYAAEQTAGHFGALARTVAMPKDGRTLEDVVRDLLKPMLRDWLDTYLPAIVEARVQAEVERVSRRQDY